MLKLIKAQIEDSRAVYDIRTSPEVRSVSYSHEEFSFESHHDWFTKSLQNPRRKIYVIQDESEIAGVVRFDLNETLTEATVSVFVSPKKWGRGIGTFALKEGERELKNECASVKKMIAFVLLDNEASLNVFEKCAYKQKMIQLEKVLE